ncbi:MAG TPA: M67 family metallopeptidase [Chitinophagaceae bacterium]|jgi:proteasome lid subunit RPN8/RPN11|nr:M67 family metallopeptidase [Chitinophagaceae bacterium]
MLILHDIAKEEMIADALAAFPDECCGFLFGEEEGDERIITAIQAVNNVKEGDKTRRFEIAPQDYLEAERFAAQNGLQLLGIYHSHPDHPSFPSEHDRVAAQPYFSYIIVSVIRGNWSDTRSWRLNDEHQFEEEVISDYQLIKN